MIEREHDMAFAHDTRTAAQGSSAWGRLADLRAYLAERIATYRLYRATLSELDGLTDRDLNDLGLSRSDLAHLAWTSAQAA